MLSFYPSCSSVVVSLAAVGLAAVSCSAVSLSGISLCGVSVPGHSLAVVILVTRVATFHAEKLTSELQMLFLRKIEQSMGVPRSCCSLQCLCYKTFPLTLTLITSSTSLNHK